jgi:hypothetical protein
LADDGACPGFNAASAASNSCRASTHAGDFIGSPARVGGACANDAACTAARSTAPTVAGSKRLKEWPQGQGASRMMPIGQHRGPQVRVLALPRCRVFVSAPAL